MILNIKAKILLKEEVVPNIFLIKLLAPLIAQEAIPGQFMHIKCSQDYYPLLRRPISIHRIDKEKGEIFILFQVVGEGSKLLSQKAIGDELDILGPLGNGFNIYPQSQKIMIVGGGIGVASLLALAEESIRQGKEVRVLIGALKRELVLGEESFRSLGAKVDIITDDGSYKHKGLITNLLEEDIQEGWLPDQIFTCGPKPMLRKIAEIASKANIDGQVSLEEHMGCGIGACLGCVCKIKTNLSACLPERGPVCRAGTGRRSQSGNAQAEEKNNNKEEYDYKRVCVDGPVFKANEVIWDD